MASLLAAPGYDTKPYYNNEMNLVNEGYYDAKFDDYRNQWCRDHPPCDGVRNYFSPRMLESSHERGTYRSTEHLIKRPKGPLRLQDEYENTDNEAETIKILS